MNNIETVKRLAAQAGKEFKGCIKNWSIHENGEKCVLGELIERDNQLILTSNVVWIEADYDYVETQNSFYRLVGARSPSPLIPNEEVNQIIQGCVNK